MRLRGGHSGKRLLSNQLILQRCQLVMPEARPPIRYGETALTPLEREIRDLLREAEVVPMSTPGEIENARQLALELRDYAAQAKNAGFPYTQKLLRAVRANIEMLIREKSDGRNASAPRST
jgi:hypothetical protein